MAKRKEPGKGKPSRGWLRPLPKAMLRWKQRNAVDVVRNYLGEINLYEDSIKRHARRLAARQRRLVEFSKQGRKKSIQDQIRKTRRAAFLDRMAITLQKINLAQARLSLTDFIRGLEIVDLREGKLSRENIALLTAKMNFNAREIRELQRRLVHLEDLPLRKRFDRIRKQIEKLKEKIGSARSEEEARRILAEAMRLGEKANEILERLKRRGRGV